MRYDVVLAYIPLAYIFISTLIKYHEYSNPSKTLIIYMIMFFATIIIFIVAIAAINRFEFGRFD